MTMMLNTRFGAMNGKVGFTCSSFDLFHAFCHCSFDPNYTYLHWALYGNLKDRVTINEKNKETANKLRSLPQDS